MKTKMVNFRDGLKEIAVGMVIVETNGRGGTHFNKWTTEVIKIGNKLITLKSGGKYYFNGNEQTEYCQGSIYSSEAAYLKCEKEEKIIDKTKRFISHLGFSFTYQQALELIKLFNIPLDKE